MLINGKCHCGDIAGHRYAVVNVNVLEKVDRAWLRPAIADFDGEDTSSRLERRTRNWIADVRIAAGPA